MNSAIVSPLAATFRSRFFEYFKLFFFRLFSSTICRLDFGLFGSIDKQFMLTYSTYALHVTQVASHKFSIRVENPKNSVWKSLTQVLNRHRTRVLPDSPRLRKTNALPQSPEQANSVKFSEKNPIPRC